MYCKNCGYQINEGANFCRNCGASVEKMQESQLNRPAINKKKIFKICGIVGVSIVLGAVLLLPQKSKRPENEQIQMNLENEVLEDTEVVSDFTIDSIQEIDNQYSGLAIITYNDGLVEYCEKYNFVYVKNDEWVLSEVEEYDKTSWSKKPIVAPSLEEYTEKCMERAMSASGISDYDKFVGDKNKTQENLEIGEVIFVFDVEKQEPIDYISGEIEFLVSFDEMDGTWGIQDFTYCDSYKIEHNFLRTWVGYAAHSGYHSTGNPAEDEFILEIEEYVEGKAKGTLIQNDEIHYMEGNINTDTEEMSTYTIELLDINNGKYHLEGWFADGTIYGLIDTAYNPNSSLFYPKDRYDVEFILQE